MTEQENMPVNDHDAIYNPDGIDIVPIHEDIEIVGDIDPIHDDMFATETEEYDRSGLARNGSTDDDNGGNWILYGLIIVAVVVIVIAVITKLRKK